MNDKLSREQIESDLRFAVDAARRAGDRLGHLRELGRWRDETLAEIADQAADGYLQGMIQGRYPDDGLLSEETLDGPERQGRARTWIVDPLDGSREYGQRRHDWAVHVALTLEGQCALAALALPAVGRLIWGVCWPGHERAGLEGEGRLARGDEAQRPRPRIAVTRNRTPPWIPALCERLDADVVPSGSAGYKVALLLLGQADIYVHRHGLKEWDTCAPETVARALGWEVCRTDGSPHRYNQPDPRNGQIVVCRPAFKGRLLEALEAATRNPVSKSRPLSAPCPRVRPARRSP